MDLLNNPIFQVALAPLLLALLVCAVLSAALRGRAGVLAVGLGISAGFLLAFGLLEGIPPFPPPASKQKIFYVVLAGGLLGLIVDLLRGGSWSKYPLLLVGPALVLAWFAWRQLGSGPDAAMVGRLALLWLGSSLVLVRLGRVADQDSALAASIPLLLTAVAASGVAWFGASLSLTMLCAAVAAAVGGVALWLYGLRGVRGQEGDLGVTALLGGGGALVACVGVLGLYTPKVSDSALALLVLVPFAGIVTRGLWYADNEAVRRWLAPVALTLACLVPALLAVAVAWYLVEPASSYGY